MRTSSKTLLMAALAAVLMAGGCQTSPKTEADKQKLTADAQAALAGYKAKDSSLQALLDKSVGYAVFPDVGKAAWFVGGAYGRGEVYEKGKKIGYADISEVSAGFTWGAQNFSELLIFMKQEKLDEFKKGDWSVGGNVSAVALSAGAAATTDPSKGVIALVDAKGGLMAEAAVGGQRMRFHAEP